MHSLCSAITNTSVLALSEMVSLAKAAPTHVHNKATIGIIDGYIKNFQMIHDRLPDSIDEFIESGFMPVNRYSVNPYTGELFMFDGSYGDIHYANLSEDERLGYELYFVNEEGEQFRFFSY